MKQFKNVLFISAIAILFVGNVGVDIFKHVCKEDGVFVSYFIDQGEEHCNDHIADVPPCCKKEKEKKDDCCDDEVDHFQIKLDFFNNISQEDFTPTMALVTCPEFVHPHVTLLDYYTSKYVNPPPPSSREILLAKEVLII